MSLHPYEISITQLQTALQNCEPIQLVDVRTLEKHQKFNIGGNLIPIDTLAERSKELDPKQPIVTYCTSGGKSLLAVQILLNLGFSNVKSLAGGMNAWQMLHKEIVK